MSKVLFVARYPLQGKYNLRAKFDGQMQAIQTLGYDVYYLAYDNLFYYIVHNQRKTPLRRVFATNSSFFHHFLSYVYLYKSVVRVLESNDWKSVDCAYIRSMPRDYYWGKMKKKMNDIGMQIVVENPTYITKGDETPKLFIRVIRGFLKIFGKDKYTTLYTLIGDKTNGFFNNTPAINIDNGVNVQAFTPRTPTRHNGFNMVAVGNMADWHGFDRVINGLSKYDNKDCIHFYVVGNDGDGSLGKWKKISESKGLSDIVHFTGPLFGDELLELLNKCDVAFASLGLYRTGCFNASVLKSREYMSRGIPFVYAVNDPVLDLSPIKYALKISNDETPVDIKQIVCFAKDISHSSNMINEMREYAIKHMSWEGQFEKVFDSLKNN